MNSRIRSGPDNAGVVFPSVVFIVGSPMYYKAKPQGNIMLEVCKCIGVSLTDTIKTSNQSDLKLCAKQHIFFDSVCHQ